MAPSEVKPDPDCFDCFDLIWLQPDCLFLHFISFVSALNLPGRWSFRAQMVRKKHCSFLAKATPPPQAKGTLMKNLLCLVLLCSCSVAMADYFTQSYNTYYAPTYIANNANLSSATYLAIRNQARDQLSEQQTRTNKTPTGNAGASNKTSMGFVPSKTVAAKTADLLLADVAKQAGVNLQQVKTKLSADGQTNLGPMLMNEATQSLGLPKNDLASALTFFCVIAQQTLTGKSYPKGAAKTVHSNLARSFGADTAFGSLSNDQRQAFSDYLGWIGLLMLQHKKTNPEAAQRATLKLLGELGLDAAKLARLAEG